MQQFCPFCGTGIIFEGAKAQCGNCGKSIYLNSKPTVGVVFVHQNKLLVCKRGIEPGKGKFDTLGGFLEYGENAIDGAVRETEEETGFHVEKNELEYVGSWIVDYRFEGASYMLLCLIYIVRLDNIPKMEAKDDVGELVWVEQGEEVDAAFPQINEILRGVEQYLDKTASS